MMFKPGPNLLFFLFIVSSAATSCYQSRKAQTSAAINQTKATIASEDSLLTNVQDLQKEKNLLGDIDKTANDKISVKLGGYQKRSDSLKQVIANLETQISTARLYRKQYKKTGIKELAALQNEVNNKDLARKRMYTLEMLMDVLRASRKNQFPLAAFFGSGEYKVFEENLPLVEQSFQPLIDSIIRFSNKFADIKRDATISVYGYADGQPVNPESALAATLQFTLGKPAAGSQDLNKELSRLRAMEMFRHIQFMFGKRSQELLGQGNLSVNHVVEGLGETLPNPNIKDYQVDDERRRIVLFYWSVIPK